MNRRELLSRAGLTALAVVALPLVIPAESFMVRAAVVPPTLHADGIHDDTAALQALLDQGGRIDLGGRVYRITESLRVSHSGTQLRNGTIVGVGIYQILWLQPDVSDVGITVGFVHLPLSR